MQSFLCFLQVIARTRFLVEYFAILAIVNINLFGVLVNQRQVVHGLAGLIGFLLGLGLVALMINLIRLTLLRLVLAGRFDGTVFDIAFPLSSALATLGMIWLGLLAPLIVGVLVCLAINGLVSLGKHWEGRQRA